jgi:hypothetical protein
MYIKGVKILIAFVAYMSENMAGMDFRFSFHFERRKAIIYLSAIAECTIHQLDAVKVLSWHGRPQGNLGSERHEGATAAHITWSRQVAKHYYDVVQKQLERKDLFLGKDLIVMGT